MIREKWKTVPIKSVYHGLYDGPHATPAPCTDGPVFLGIKNVTDDGALDLTDIRHISESEFPRWTKRVNPQPGDIVFTYEATLNRYAIVPDGFRGCLGRRMALIRANPEKIDTRFLHFYFFSKQWREVISNNTLTGATVDRIPLTKFPEFPITIPDLPTQRKIAGILSAYDDLIENNLRRIKILEQMAQSLYREWFVHFRFPGHESARFIESDIGRIPKGWEVVPMGEFVQFKSGFAFKSSKFTDDGEHRLVTIKNVQDGVFNPVSDSLLDELPEKLPSYCILEDGDILLSLTGNVGRVCLVYAGPFLLNQRVAKLTPVSSSDWMLAYCVFRSFEMRTALEMLSNGVAQQNLSPVQASKMDFPQPPEILRERFASIAEPIGHHIVQLYNANQNLRRTRDLLLPKLLASEK